MAIDKRTATWYRLKCDRCGAWAPESPVKEEALWQAEQAGWQHLSKWNGLAYVHTDLCPDCFGKWEEEQAEGWEEARAQQEGWPAEEL